MRQIGSMLLIMLICALSALGQPRNMMREEPGELPRFLFFELVNLIAHDSSLSRLDIHYRIDQVFFVAVKSRDTSSPSSFLARGEVLIEVFDSAEVSKARSIQKVEIITNQSDRELLDKKWYQGIASFEVPPGRYKIVIEVDDFESERRFIDDRTTISLKRFATASREPSTPLFVQWKPGQTSSDPLIPVGFGPNLLFGKAAAIYVELPSAADTINDVRAEYSIAATSNANHSTSVAAAETLTNLMRLPKVRLSSKPHEDGPTYSISSNDSSKALGVIIPLASDQLPLRRYDLALNIRLGSVEFKASKKFQMVWPDMPFSLRDIDYAINALKYISSEGQRDSLRRGDIDERRDKLEAFWRGKDNTPETAYNEVMVEYYRRVDHATRTFGTLREPDGFKSDRGRIYILHGPPTKLDRILSPTAGYQEVWLHEKTGKKFIFADQTKSGNYVLISSEQL